MATFLGFKQIKLSTWNGLEESAKTGYLWFVRDEATNDGDVFFGKKHYGHFSSAATAVDVVKLAEAVSGLTEELGTLALEEGQTWADVISGMQTTLDGTISSANTVAALEALDGAKVDKEEGKSLVDDDEIVKLSGIEANAQENVIETIEVNGSALPVSAKTVNIVLSGYVTSETLESAKDMVLQSAAGVAVASASTIAENAADAARMTAEANAVQSAKTIIETQVISSYSGLSASTVVLEDKVSTLIGEDSGKTARDIAIEEVAKVVSGAPEAFDTLKEISDWIDTHQTSAITMANDIETLKASAATLDNKFNDYATSADTVAAINAVDEKFVDYATSADTAEAINAVDDKFANYATSADTAQAIKDAVDASVASAVTLESGIATEISEKKINVLVASGSVDTVVSDNGKNFLYVTDENELKVDGVDTDAAVFSKDITIAGGPLADIAKKAYTDGKVPSGTTLQEFFMSLLCVEIWGAAKGPTYSFTASVTKPAIQLSSNGQSVPVGTIVTASTTAQGTTGVANAKVTGMTYGYSTNGTATASTATSYTQSVSVAREGSATVSCSWSGFKEVDESVDGTSGASKQFYVMLGSNTYSASETGQTCTPSAFTAVSIYAASNLGNISGDCATISEEGFEASSAYEASKTPTNSNSASVTGYYPIYYGQIDTTDATADDLTEAVIKGGSSSSSVPTSVDILLGTACYFVAVPSGNTNYTKTSMTVINKTTKATFGKSQTTTKDIAMLNDVANVNYKVFFIANGGAWPEASTTFDEISFE